MTYVHPPNSLKRVMIGFRHTDGNGDFGPKLAHFGPYIHISYLYIVLQTDMIKFIVLKLGVQ